MGGMKWTVLFLTVLLSIRMAMPAHYAACQSKEEKLLSPGLRNIATASPENGQSQELRCHYPLKIDKGLELLWFKTNLKGTKLQVSNTSDGRVAIYEDTVDVAKVGHIVSQRCKHPQNTTFLRSILSIRNVEDSDYGIYVCHTVINNATKPMSEYWLTDPIMRWPWFRDPDPKLSKWCTARLICKFSCFDCCACDTGLCEMLLLKDGKQVLSTTSVSHDQFFEFESSFEIYIDGLEDFGDYRCALRQQVVDCIDGSMITTSVVKSLHLDRPEALFRNPKVSIKANEVVFSCHYGKWPTSTAESWEVVLLKDDDKIASNPSPLSDNNVVEGSFTLNNIVDVYGRYECMLRSKDNRCMKPSLFKRTSFKDRGSTSLLLPPPVCSYARSMCRGSLTWHSMMQSVGNSSQILPSPRTSQVLWFNVKSTCTDAPGILAQSVEFPTEARNLSSLGIVECVLEKSVSRRDVETPRIPADGEIVYISNALKYNQAPKETFSKQLNVSLGSIVHLPCSVASDDVRRLDYLQLEWYRNGLKITGEDHHTSFSHKRFRMVDKFVSFLFCVVKFDVEELFGTYECRCRNNTNYNGTLMTLQTFTIEPLNWKDQAQDLYQTTKACRNAVASNSQIRDNNSGLFQHERMDDKVIDTAMFWKSRAIKEQLVITAGLIVTIFCFCGIGKLCLFIKRKLEERDMRITLGYMHDMEALGEGTIEEGPQHDVFISYSSEDASWVRGSLLDNLESNGYNVCLDERDFVPGKPVLTNISNAIYQSRKVILVMSNNFINSGWCRHEMALTYQRKLDQKENCVVVVKYDDCKIPRGLALRTYLDWTKQTGKEKFWAKLYKWLGPPNVPVEACIASEIKER